MNSRPKSSIYGLFNQNIPKKAYITKTVDITSNNAISFDKLISSKKQGDAAKSSRIDHLDDIIKKYKVYFQNEPKIFEGSKVEKVSPFHRCVSTESKGMITNRERKRKLNIETKNPLINEKIRKYRDLKQISKSCNLVPPRASRSNSTSKTTLDKQDNKINRFYRFVSKSKDAVTNKAYPEDHCVTSQISFCNKQTIPTYSALYDSDARRKSLLRTVRLQRLLNRLIILKARQKKKLNWINFIKELKAKHKLTREPHNGHGINQSNHITALVDSYSSNSNTDITRPYRTRTTANISNFHYKINTSTKNTNPFLRYRSAEFRNPHKTNTTSSIRNFYRKYNIADTCKLETSISKRRNNKSKFTTKMIDDFFNPEPKKEGNSLLKFTELDASIKFEKILRANEKGRVCTYSKSSSNLSLFTKKASRSGEIIEKYSKAFFPKPFSNISKSQQKSSITIQRSYSFIRANLKRDDTNPICSTYTQTHAMPKLTSEKNKDRHKSFQIKSPRVSEVSQKSFLDILPQKLDTQGIMEAKIDSILQSVNSLLTEIRNHKSKIIVAENEASQHNENIQEKKTNLNETEKNSKRRYILNEYLELLNFDRPKRRESMQERSNYKSYPVSFALYTKDKSIEVSKSLANNVEETKSDDEQTDITLQETRITPINNNNNNFLSLVKTILPSPYEAIKKIISYVPSISYFDYLTMLPMPVTLKSSSKPLNYKYHCNLCGTRFEKAAYLSRHIELNHLSKIRDCCVCRHVIDTESRKPGVFRCCYCSQVFTRAYCCELHQQSCAEKMGMQHDVRPSLLFLR